MGIPREEWDGWANADSAIVHPDYRGNGLQRKLLEAALTRLRPGIVGIGATVSPENQYSLNNALASGFEIVCWRRGCKMIQLRVSSERRGCSFFAMPEKSHYS